MRHFPIFLALQGRRVVLSGGGGAALAKLRLLMKTEARIEVFAADPAPEIEAWAAARRLTLHRRALQAADLQGAALAYAADEDARGDARTAALARTAGVLVNVVDDLDASQFLTPAIVDRDPVTVAIGTEGAAPVLARAIKADLEARLSPRLGALARLAQGFRGRAAALPQGRRRRAFWSAWFDRAGPQALDAGGPAAAETALEALLAAHLDAAPQPGHVIFAGAGPGDPDLLTLKARKALDRADVVLHDRLVPPAILDLARREATLIDVGKQGFGPALPQAEINALLVRHGQAGAQVLRLKGGDPAVFARLDEEIDAVAEAGLGWEIVPGITAASAAAASIGQALTRRGRNAGLRVLTGHDMAGFAEQDWHALATPGTVAAIYMGKRAARFLQGRLMMHGASEATPVTVVENASRPDERVLASSLGRLSRDLEDARPEGPAILLYGLAPRAAAAVLSLPRQEVS